MRFLLAVIAATVVISMSDWLFFGMLFHGRYAKTPELWRQIPEGKKIALSMLFAAIGSAAFIAYAHHLQITTLAAISALTVHTWLAASLPQTVTNTLYLKYDPVLVVSHSAGWLARLVIAAAAYCLVGV